LINCRNKYKSIKIKQKKYNKVEFNYKRKIAICKNKKSIFNNKRQSSFKAIKK